MDPRALKPGETQVLRYWPVHKSAPAGWVDVAPMGAHLWRGKIIRKADDGAEKDDR